mgnify:CR=1 FL=1
MCSSDLAGDVDVAGGVGDDDDLVDRGLGRRGITAEVCLLGAGEGGGAGGGQGHGGEDGEEELIFHVRFRFYVRGAATAPRVVLVCHLASVARQSLVVAFF